MTSGSYRITRLRTLRAFAAKGACSEALCHVLGRAFDQGLPGEEHASTPLAGGILRHGYQCGLLWGAALAAGARAHRAMGASPAAETAAIRACARLAAALREGHGDINCLELTRTDWRKPSQIVTYFLKGRLVRCFRMAADFAPVARLAIEAEIPGGAASPPAPVSCAAEVLRRMGADEAQAIMASGLAGGIGLCGGACGALGAAVWHLALRAGRGGDLEPPGAGALVERFLKASDYRFECQEIVGRRFDGVEDHAAHLAGGGCAGILEALACG